MAEIGISIAEKLIEVVGSPVIQKFCALWGYKSELQELSKTVATIKNVLLDAEAKRGDLSNEVRGYIEELKAAVYDADDLFDEFRTRAELNQFDSNIKDDKFLKKVLRFFFCCKKKGVTQAYRMSTQVIEIKKQLDGIVSNHQKFGLSDHDYKPTIRRREETCSYVDAHDIIGREDDKNAVIKMLLGASAVNEDIRVVTIVGAGGLGKTTLAQLVYNDEKVKEKFLDSNLRLWVCVSDQEGQQFDVKAILRKILELLPKDNNLENNSSLEKVQSGSSLEKVQSDFQKRMKEKKYLLVLDDVWNEDRGRWKNLEKFLRVGERESRIIVTTRSKKTAEIIGDEHTYTLGALSPKDSWDLFEMTAFRKEDKNGELVEIGEKIVDKCSNNPLAIKVVGSNLYGQDINKWRSFEASGLRGIENGDNEIMSILMLSYHNLRSSLKSCFSYCALFPKDTKIKKEMLIRLWMAQGYIVPFDKGQSIEDAAEEHFVILLRRCFFQNVKKDEYGNIKSVILHDLMHDVAQEVRGEEICMLSCITDHLGDNTRHVYHVGNEHSEDSSSSLKIRSFISKYSIKCPVVTQANNWMRLRVLALPFLRMENLPDSIGTLIHLRYLDLSSNDFSFLPDSITGLHNLQTLILSDCYCLKELPRDFNRLVNLRYLCLEGCFRLECMPLGMDKLSNLRVLNKYVVGKRKSSGDGLKNLKALTNIRGHMDIDIGREYKKEEGGAGGYLESMKHLTSLVLYITIECENDAEAVLEKLKPPPNLKEIELRRYRGQRIPASWGRNEDNWGISFPHLVHIDIDSCRGLEYLPSLSKLPCLKTLILDRLEKVEYMENRSETMIGESTTFFPSLLSLTIDNLKQLKGWWRGEGSVNDAVDADHPISIYSTSTFPRLSHLSIQCCPNLTSFPICPLLENLNIFRCPNLTSFPLCPLLEDLELMGCNKKMKLQMRMTESRDEEQGEYDVKLNKFRTDYLGHLKSLPTGGPTTLVISYDNEIESLSEYEEAFKSRSSSLQHLEIWECRNLRSLSGGLEHLTALESLSIDDNSQLRFSGMPWKFLHHNLRSLRFNSLDKMTSLPKGMQYLTSLQHLSLYKCDHLKGLPEWISCLTSLHSIDISGCPKFINLPESIQNLTSLQRLTIGYYINDNKRLIERCRKHSGEYWPIIQHIPTIEVNWKRRSTWRIGVRQ